MIPGEKGELNMHKIKRSPKVVSKILQRSAENIGSPEGRLWFAVLNIALLDMATKTYRSSAEHFFSSTHFDNVCNYLGLNQDYAREQIALLDIPQRPD